MRYLTTMIFCLAWMQLHIAAASGAENRFGFVLDIFGNADMNWTIDSADLEYVRNVIKGITAATPYAYAKG